jgi:hypothetical protein
VEAMSKVTPPHPLTTVFAYLIIIIIMQVREFQKVKTLLFDGESALRSPALQKEIKNKLQIKIHAEPYWKRSLAERAIGELKIRMAIHLDFNGNVSLPIPGNKKNYSPFFFRTSLKQMER